MVGGLRLFDDEDREVSGTLALLDIMQLMEDGALSPTSPLLGPLAPGTYRLEVEFSMGATMSRTVDLNGEPELELPLRAPR